MIRYDIVTMDHPELLDEWRKRMLRSKREKERDARASLEAKRKEYDGVPAADGPE